MIASSEVASARIWGSSRKITSAGTKRIPPPTPSSPPTAPPANPSSAAPTYSISRSPAAIATARRRIGEQQRDGALGQRAAERAVPATTPGDRRDPDQDALEQARRCRAGPGRSPPGRRCRRSPAGWSRLPRARRRRTRRSAAGRSRFRRRPRTCALNAPAAVAITASFSNLPPAIRGDTRPLG